MGRSGEHANGSGVGHHALITSSLCQTTTRPDALGRSSPAVGRIIGVELIEESRSSHRSRTVTVGFVGSVVRRMGNWMPITATVALLGECGVDESSARTAVFRLKKRGWLTPETRGRVRGYALTSVALDALASGDAIIWHPRPAASLDDGWCIVSFSIPEAVRARRHQLRTHLAALGFGNADSALWIAPARATDSALQAIAELELTEHCIVFVGPYRGGQDLVSLVGRAWDLDGIAQRYREFILLQRAQLDRLASSPAVDGHEAFAAYLNAIEHWRKLPFRDPGLPTSLLGDDWPAIEAGKLFETIVAQWEGRALAHAAGYWPKP
ncbi:PaaX family transcriptional regulator [Nocardia pseudovaccinii]|uniref:PaaX family transcriptional regulator n=1 Tax=Nocardia pseudovaccinii TaxID=189540 RepID=UPI003D8AD4AA